MLDNPMHSGLQAHQERAEAREARLSLAYQQLRTEFVTALFADPQTTIATPGFVPTSMRCIDVVEEQFSNEASGPLAALLRLLVVAAEHDAPELRVPAQAIVMRMARAHATYHAQDMADQQEDEACGPL